VKSEVFRSSDHGDSVVLSSLPKPGSKPGPPMELQVEVMCTNHDSVFGAQPPPTEVLDTFPAQPARVRNGRRVVTLEDCLHKFVETEQLGESERWECDACKEKCRAYKKMELWSAPDVLCIHLKRFQVISGFGYRLRRRKLNIPVTIPLEMDLKEFIRGPQDASTVYDAFGVVKHMGDLSSGHYVSFVKDHHTQRWFHFNDRHVRPSQAPTVRELSENTYMVFYLRRGGSQPFGGVTPCLPGEWPVKNGASEANGKKIEQAAEEEQQLMEATSTVAAGQKASSSPHPMDMDTQHGEKAVDPDHQQQQPKEEEEEGLAGGEGTPRSTAL